MCYALVDNLVVMTTSMISTAILMHRRGISQDLLNQRIGFIYDEILERNGLVSPTLKPTPQIIKKGLSYLKDFIESKRDIFEPSITAKTGEKSILMLAYYRNNLTHIFMNEAEIACSLLGFSIDKEASLGITADQVWNKTQFLKTLLNEEFVLRDTMRT